MKVRTLRSTIEMGEFVFENLPSAVDASPDRLRCAVENVGNFRVAHVFMRKEHERLAKVVGKLPHCESHGVGGVS